MIRIAIVHRDYFFMLLSRHILCIRFSEQIMLAIVWIVRDLFFSDYFNYCIVRLPFWCKQKQNKKCELIFLCRVGFGEPISFVIDNRLKHCEREQATHKSNRLARILWIVVFFFRKFMRAILRRGDYCCEDEKKSSSFFYCCCCLDKRVTSPIACTFCAYEMNAAWDTAADWSLQPFFFLPICSTSILRGRYAYGMNKNMLEK